MVGRRCRLLDRRGFSQPVQRAAHPPSTPAFSRDGRQIAFVHPMTGPYGELVLADAATGRLRQLTGDAALPLSPVWSPDDRWLYFASSRGGTFNLWRISPRGGEPEQVTTGQGNDAELDLSADGRRLVFSTYRSNINLAEVALDPTPPGPAKWLTQDSARGPLPAGRANDRGITRRRAVCGGWVHASLGCHLNSCEEMHPTWGCGRIL